MPEKIRSKARGFWLTIHLYIGLSIGLVFVLSGLTGSLLVFYLEIDELLNPHLQISKTGQKRSYETIFQNLKITHPERTSAWRLEIPSDPQRMITARYYKPKETEHLLFGPLMVSVNPYTAEITGSRIWGEFLMTWIYNLHYQLLLDNTGRILMTIIGTVLLVSLTTGVYLWWPSKSKILTAFTIKKNTSSQRFVYDIHKLNGIYSLLVLAIIVGTGAILSLPPLKDLVNSISPVHHPQTTESHYSQNARRITLDHAVSIAKSQFPESELKWIETPKNPTGSYRINLRQAGEPSPRFPKTNVWIDQYNGTILSVRDVKYDSAGDTFLRWLHPLHSGEAFGLTGRIIVCISGFVPLVLYITGFMRWQHKQRAKQR